ncbi:Phage integrase family protein [Anaerocolumna jejuensis DSM 15929]|uniref:Phage integrase family protein n=1 Tax=Anaerocolumna jejuensis DSM 15929 TaxID=1121322 RepID=A0A1M6LXT1_9FIRM|nr:tyrosine-type recombinase/integrase [Anaerocolumna jejuensis]SHJ75913.1 Phage integrase family protein [Anaerocolumna jejuensis DSM 15929]
MNTTEPIKNQEELESFKNYYTRKERNQRNQTLLTVGLNTALRISDILSLQWGDVFDFEKQAFREHIIITEQKTQKKSVVFINDSILHALRKYMGQIDQRTPVKPDNYILEGNNHQALSRTQAWRIIKKAANACQIEGIISPHSLRKTFGYQAWKKGVTPILLMSIYNHSSFEITKRYLGIGQDERDDVFRNICI